VKMQVVLTLSISVWRGGDIHSTERGRSSWLFVEFFVLKRAVRPRVRAFWYSVPTYPVLQYISSFEPSTPKCRCVALHSSVHLPTRSSATAEGPRDGMLVSSYYVHEVWELER